MRVHGNDRAIPIAKGILGRALSGIASGGVFMRPHVVFPEDRSPIPDQSAGNVGGTRRDHRLNRPVLIADFFTAFLAAVFLVAFFAPFLTGAFLA
jgi:hypothetical protein